MNNYKSFTTIHILDSGYLKIYKTFLLQKNNQQQTSIWSLAGLFTELLFLSWLYRATLQLEVNGNGRTGLLFSICTI